MESRILVCVQFMAAFVLWWQSSVSRTETLCPKDQNAYNWSLDSLLQNHFASHWPTLLDLFSHMHVSENWKNTSRLSIMLFIKYWVSRQSVSNIRRISQSSVDTVITVFRCGWDCWHCLVLVPAILSWWLLLHDVRPQFPVPFSAKCGFEMWFWPMGWEWRNWGYFLAWCTESSLSHPLLLLVHWLCGKYAGDIEEAQLHDGWHPEHQ